MATGSSHSRKKAARRTKRGVQGVKVLISAAALAATLSGWVAFAASDREPASASASASQAPTSLNSSQAPQPVTVTRSSR
jgi:hypothetical protein